MSSREIPAALMPTPAYLELAAEVLKLEGFDVIGVPVAEGFVDDADSPMLSICFTDKKDGLLITDIPIPQEGSGEL